MRKIYIDGGAHCGDTVRQFLQGELVCGRSDYQEFSIYAFDPVDYTDEWSKIIVECPDVAISFEQKALCIVDGRIPLSIHSDTYATTTSPDCVKFDQGRTCNVPCIDFEKWLRETVTAEDFVVIKLDIEGAEFDILDKLISTGAIKLIDHLIVEFHDFVMPGYGQRKADILRLSPVPIQAWG